MTEFNHVDPNIDNKTEENQPAMVPLASELASSTVSPLSQCIRMHDLNYEKLTITPCEELEFKNQSIGSVGPKIFCSLGGVLR